MLACHLTSSEKLSFHVLQKIAVPLSEKCVDCPELTFPVQLRTNTNLRR